MKHLILIAVLLTVSMTALCQVGFEGYEDLIDLEEEFTLEESNLEEIKGIGLRNFWYKNQKESTLGFIGSNYRRLHIKFLSVIKDHENPTRYFVYGKTKVSKNICPFQGIIEIKSSHYINSSDYLKGTAGILVGDYIFHEDPQNNHSGIFKGRFATYWIKDKEGNIKYNDLGNVSAMYNNNQFAGKWISYDKKNTLTANWGDSRIPQSDELDNGTSEFYPNSKYNSFGWESFNKAWGGGYSEEEIKKARDEELEIWWKEK